MEHLWEKVKASLATRIPSHSFRMWIEPIEIEEINSNVMGLNCPNLFFRKRIMEHFSETIREAIEQLAGTAVRIEVRVAIKKHNSSSPMHPPKQLPLPNMTIQPHSGRLLRKDYTFDQFVVGKNNDFAYSAALSLAAQKNSRSSKRSFSFRRRVWARATCPRQSGTILFLNFLLRGFIILLQKTL